MRVDVEALKRRHPIEEVIAARGVQLRRLGRHLAGCCPFHEDRRPSLTVYPETASFHCFGCGAGGDVIDFVRRADGIGFLDAVERLGGGTNDAHGAPEERRLVSLDDRLMLLTACELYHETLMRTPEAVAYVERRGIPQWVLRRFRLGYSDGRGLVPYLRRRRLSVHRARELGLLNRNDSEAMAGRLVVPELRAGRCDWMIGRSLDDGREPKYRGLALPKPLLGWELVRGRHRVFVTEGPFDWLTLVSWGLPACALLGTQPGSAVLQLLGRARSIVLALDADEAGQEAAERIRTALGERAFALNLPEGVKDVSELGGRPEGREEFFALLDVPAGHGDGQPR
jgi:DNA primase